MKDPNHAWNEGKPIRSKRQSCGCHITAKKLELCPLGKDFRYWADKIYGLYLSQKDVPCNGHIIDGCKSRLEMYKKIYITHLAKGWDWPQMMWGKDRCL